MLFLVIPTLLFMSGEIRPNPGHIDPCSFCTRLVIKENSSLQCTNCSLCYINTVMVSPFPDLEKFYLNSWILSKCPSPFQTPPYLILRNFYKKPTHKN